MNKLNHLEKERKDGRKQDRAAVPTEFQTSTKNKTKQKKVFFARVIKKKLGGEEVEKNGGKKADQSCISCKNIGTGSIPAWRDQSYDLDFSSLFSGRRHARFIQTLLLSHQPLLTWLLLPCDVAMRSHDSLGAAVRGTQVLLTTDGLPDRGRVKVKYSLELFYRTKQNHCFLLHQSTSAAFIGKKCR